MDVLSTSSVGGGRYQSFGDWLKKQREAKTSREGHRLRQDEVAARLKARLQEQGVSNPRVSRSLISMLEGDRLRPSIDMFDAILAEFDVKDASDVAELRRLASQPLTSTTIEPLGTSTRQMKAVEMAIDSDQEELHNTFKKIKDYLDKVEEEGRYLKLKGGQLARIGVAHTTISVTTFLLLLERLSSIVIGSAHNGGKHTGSQKIVPGLDSIALRLENLDEKLSALAITTKNDDRITTALQEIRNEVNQTKRYIEDLKDLASLYQIGKVFGKRGGSKHIERNIQLTSRFLDSPTNLIAVLDAWDRYGGWGELRLMKVENQEWWLEFRNSFFVAEPAESAENRIALAEVWAGYLHGYIEEALQVNATAIENLPAREETNAKLQLPNRPKPAGAEEDYWVNRVEVSSFKEASDPTSSLAVSTSDMDIQGCVFTFRVIFKRDLVSNSSNEVSRAYTPDI